MNVSTLTKYGAAHFSDGSPAHGMAVLEPVQPVALLEADGAVTLPQKHWFPASTPARVKS
jgi:hypothetical protein